MKELYVKDLKTDQEITDYFIVRSAALKVGSNGKTYLDVMLADSSGEIDGKKWDIEPGEDEHLKKLHPGMILKIRAKVIEWRGSKQLRITRIRQANKEDGVHRRDFLKAAPEDPEEMYAYITGKISEFEDEELKKLCLNIYEENKDRLMYYPAAMSNHHAEYAGLLWHVKRMMMAGEKMCEVYTFLDKDLLLAGVAVHDIEKLNEIISDENGISPGYSFEGQMLGHIVQGVSLIHDKCAELGIGSEKTILLEHMILSHHYKPEFGSPKRPLFPEAEMLHHLDDIDAKMFDMEDTLSTVEPGSFSDKVWTLDNQKIYRKTF